MSDPDHLTLDNLHLRRFVCRFEREPGVTDPMADMANLFLAQLREVAEPAIFELRNEDEWIDGHHKQQWCSGSPRWTIGYPDEDRLLLRADLPDYQVTAFPKKSALGILFGDRRQPVSYTDSERLERSAAPIMEAARRAGLVWKSAEPSYDA